MKAEKDFRMLIEKEMKMLSEGVDRGIPNHNTARVNRSMTGRQAQTEVSLKIYTEGQLVYVPVDDDKTEFKIFEYHDCVGLFVEYGDETFLDEFRGTSIVDSTGTRYILETRPDTLLEILKRQESMESPCILGPDNMDTHDYFKEQRARIQEEQLYEQVVALGNYCPLCGVVLEPFDIERHHISGKQNSNLVIPLCRICHGRLSRKQYCWPDEWTQPNNNPSIRRALMLRGLSDIMYLSAQQLRYASNDIIMAEVGPK